MLITDIHILSAQTTMVSLIVQQIRMKVMEKVTITGHMTVTGVVVRCIAYMWTQVLLLPLVTLNMPNCRREY